MSGQTLGGFSLHRHYDGGNHGISASRNLAMQNAKGAVIAFLDADDVWLPHRLESQLALFELYPDAAMIYAQAERWYDFDLPYSVQQGSAGKNFVPSLIPETERPGVVEPPKLLEWFLEDESMTPCTCSVLVRTNIARKYRGFEDSFYGLFDDQGVLREACS